MDSEYINVQKLAEAILGPDFYYVRVDRWHEGLIVFASARTKFSVLLESPPDTVMIRNFKSNLGTKYRTEEEFSKALCDACDEIKRMAK